jgi:hypothetical protein
MCRGQIAEIAAVKTVGETAFATLGKINKNSN